MTEGTAIEFAKLKMRELGVGDNYILRYRHIRLDPSEKIKVKGENHMYLLIDPEDLIKVSSKAGIYDVQDTAINELQHVHRGLIEVENLDLVRVSARFLQVIPLIKEKQDGNNV